jgi:AAA family ATP:ADP antiporter
MLISLLQTITRPMFGAFEREEFKKFLRMGMALTLILGSYWVLRTLKNTLFCELSGIDNQPIAKTISIISLVFLLMGYTKLLDKYSRDRVFYMLSTAYVIGCVIFGFLILAPYIGQEARALVCVRTGLAYWATQFIAYAWFVFVESYGSLIVALFWAIASDTTLPDSAKKGFSLVVAIGQIGGIILPITINTLPGKLGFSTIALSVFLCAATIYASMYFLKSLFKNTPSNLMVSYHGKNEAQEEAEQEPGFFEGARLLFQHKYLLGIFAAVAFPDLLVAIFDFHFQAMASAVYQGPELASYMGLYGSIVNLVALSCLLLGIGNVTRILGVPVALMLIPLIFAGAILGFVTLNSLNFLFALMVGSKAINYALNGPAIKQLYIPTTHDTRFKAQAWIETFGSRGSKEGGALFNLLLKPLQRSLGEVAGRARHVALSSYVGFGIIAVWVFIAFGLGKTYKNAINEKKMVC